MPAESDQEAEKYSRHKAEMAAKSRARSALGRDVGPLPPVADPERRELCREDPALFAETYFPARYYLPSAPAQNADRQTMERCARNGGRFAIARPRGSGKTTDAEVAAIKAIVYGFRRFLVLFGATERHAAQTLKRIQAEFEMNDRLAEDFPEVCHPIRALERIHNRARGQTLNGKPTRIEWTAEGVTLPTVEGSPSSGSVIRVVGITGAVRGLNVLGADGRPLRPDMVIIDDPQTRESAKSPTQTADRESIISDDILGLAGPTMEIAAILLCTVIYRNDLSDRHLDPERHPEWQGSRSKLVEAFPANMDLWDEYAEIRRESFRTGDEGRRATDFYIDRQPLMDAGALVPWPGRMKQGETSEVQSAMNLYLDNPRGFFAEYQNDPAKADPVTGSKELSAEAVGGRLSGLERLAVPRECVRLTAFIDPGLSVLWYAVVAWNERGGGSVVDYGCYPRQNRTWFEARDARPSLATEFPGLTEPQLVFAGLNAIVPEVLGRTYFRESGDELRIERCLIDCGWLPSPVFQWIRQSSFAGLVYPSKGIGRSTTARGVSEWKPRPGERSGWHWRLTVPESGRIRMVQFDPDAWKSRLHELLTVPPGGPTGLNFFGRLVAAHEMIAAHCAAEYSSPITLRGTTFDKWEIRPERPDNHLLDCLVGASVAAGVAGVQWSATADGKIEPIAPRKPLRYGEQKSAAGTATIGGGLRYSDIAKQQERRSK